MDMFVAGAYGGLFERANNLDLERGTADARRETWILKKSRTALVHYQDNALNLRIIRVYPWQQFPLAHTCEVIAVIRITAG